MRFETDDEFRTRVFYVTGDHRIYSLQEKQLDRFAEEFGIIRRLIRIPPVIF